MGPHQVLVARQGPGTSLQVRYLQIGMVTSEGGSLYTGQRIPRLRRPSIDGRITVPSRYGVSSYFFFRPFLASARLNSLATDCLMPAFLAKEGEWAAAAMNFF
jgi:hypothetical protein